MSTTIAHPRLLASVLVVLAAGGAGAPFARAMMRSTKTSGESRTSRAATLSALAKAAWGKEAKDAPSTREGQRRVKPGQYERGVHPFFEVRASDEAGSVMAMHSTGGHPEDTPRCLLQHRDGSILWLTGQGDAVNVLTPKGGQWQMPAEEGDAFRFIGADADGTIRFFSRNAFGKIVLAEKSGKDEGAFPYVLHSKTIGGDFAGLASGPIRMVPADQELHGFSGSHAFRLSDRRGLKIWKFPPELVPTAFAWEPTADQWFCVRPDRDEIYVLGPNLDGASRGLPAGSRPRGVALGKDGRVWFTLSGRDEVGACDPITGECEFYSVAAKDKSPEGPRGISTGPDGNLWVTLEKGGAIARITPSGQPQFFDLPKGWKPLEITPSRDGRMLFTLDGTSQFGAITARPQVRPRYAGDPEPEAILAETKAGEEARAEGAAPRKKLSRDERWARHAEFEKRAAERYEARLTMEKEQGILAQGLAGCPPGEEKDLHPGDGKLSAGAGAGSSPGKARAEEHKGAGSAPAPGGGGTCQRL